MAVPACCHNQNRKYEVCFSVCLLNKVNEIILTGKTKQQKPSSPRENNNKCPTKPK